MKGRLPISRLKRIHSALASDKGEVLAQICFGIDEQRQRYLDLMLKADVELICERCLGALSYEIETNSRLALLESTHLSEHLPEGYEPLVLDQSDPVLLASIIEDELILALPLVPRHTQLDCNASVTKDEAKQQLQPEQSDDAVEKKNPFSVLANLRDKAD